MKNCPTCQNDLVCHDQGECLRPTPETDAVYPPEILDREYKLHGESWGWGTLYKMRKTSRSLEIRLAEARELAGEMREAIKVAREQLASEKSTRNAIIAKGIEMERQLAEAREENARLREALEWIAKRYDDNKPTHAVAMDAYEMSCTAKQALTP